MVFIGSFMINLTSVYGLSIIFIHIIVDVSSGGTIDQSILLCMYYMSNLKHWKHRFFDSVLVAVLAPVGYFLSSLQVLKYFRSHGRSNEKIQYE